MLQGDRPQIVTFHDVNRNQNEKKKLLIADYIKHSVYENLIHSSEIDP